MSNLVWRVFYMKRTQTLQKFMILCHFKGQKPLFLKQLCVQKAYFPYKMTDFQQNRYLEHFPCSNDPPKKILAKIFLWFFLRKKLFFLKKKFLKKFFFSYFLDFLLTIFWIFSIFQCFVRTLTSSILQRFSWNNSALES